MRFLARGQTRDGVNEREKSLHTEGARKEVTGSLTPRVTGFDFLLESLLYCS